MNFMEQLQAKVDEVGSRACLGMDPSVDGKAAIPRFLLEEHDGDMNATFQEFNFRILEATADSVAVIKPQIAYYEAHGALGALKATIDRAKKQGLLVILDAKRNDIGSTSTAYAKAMFEHYGAGATTVNPYLGSDCIKPFLEYTDNGIFVLVKTSNPSSKEIQDLFSAPLDGVEPTTMSMDLEQLGARADRGSLVLERNYVRVARLVASWNEDFDGEFGPAGAVIGATFPDELKYLRSIMPRSLLLIPGFGVQGGTAEDVRHAFLPRGRGAVINSSRGLLYAYALSKENKCDPGRFEDATRAELLQMNARLNAAIQS